MTHFGVSVRFHSFRFLNIHSIAPERSNNLRGCRGHHAYYGLSYWTPVSETAITESEAQRTYPFIFAEPGKLEKDECGVVSIAMADATVVSTNFSHKTIDLNEFETDLYSRSNRHCLKQQVDPVILQGTTIAIQKHQNFKNSVSGGYLKPIICTLLEPYVSRSKSELSVCVHTTALNPIVGLYKK